MEVHPGTPEQMFHTFIYLRPSTAVQPNIVIEMSTNHQKTRSPPNRLGTGIAYIYQRIKRSRLWEFFLKTERVFYQAVLNAAEFPDLKKIYLKLPSIEPPYRQGRRHIHFVTSLADQGYRQRLANQKNLAGLQHGEKWLDRQGEIL